MLCSTWNYYMKKAFLEKRSCSYCKNKRDVSERTPLSVANDAVDINGRLSAKLQNSNQYFCLSWVSLLRLSTTQHWAFDNSACKKNQNKTKNFVLFYDDNENAYNEKWT